MSGKPKEGLDYAGWSVYLFDGDTQIDRLLEAQGWVGFGIYFYLCQMAYKFKGYFYQWSYADSATTARRMGGGVKSETVRQTVGLCLQIGLFDKRLFDRDGILTSRGIQQRYYDAIQKRRRKVVIADYWLLNDEDHGGLELRAANDNPRPANDDLRQADDGLHSANGPKSKVKKSKAKYPPFIPPSGGWGFGEELESMLTKWISYKKEKRNPCTHAELDCLLARIREQTEVYDEKTVADLIHLCMSNGWMSIVWDKVKVPREFRSNPEIGRGNPSDIKTDMDRMEKYLQKLKEEKQDDEL